MTLVQYICLGIGASFCLMISIAPNLDRKQNDPGTSNPRGAGVP